MHFAILILFSLLNLVGSTLAMTAAQVVININTVATLSGNLNTAVSGLSISSEFQQVVATGQTVTTDFGTIISDLSNDISSMDGTVFGDADAQTIVVALDSFVQIHQMLLATVIGKQSIFAQFGATAPIAAVLRSLEGVIDSFAYALIDMIPTQTPAVQSGQASLDVSVQNAISEYEKLCFPSPLYPNLMPVCVSL